MDARPYPDIAFLGHYLTQMKTYVHTKSHTWIFIGVLFVIALHWKWPKYLESGELINNLLLPYNNKKEWTLDTQDNTDNLKIIMVRERSPWLQKRVNTE